jgi:penicillin amidase
MLKKIFILTAIILFLIAVAFPFSGFYLFKRALPQAEGEILLPGLKTQVTVYRDTYGVPHLFADNEEDLMYAVGFVAAQDRLWQMDFTRRAARGRLSEILGRETLEIDKFFLTLGIRRIAEEIAKNLHPDSLRILTAYVRGVNEFIRQNQDKLPPEFTLLRYSPSEWTIEDSLGYVRMMGFDMSTGWKGDLIVYKLIQKFGEEKAQELFLENSQNKTVIVPSEIRQFTELGIDEDRESKLENRDRDPQSLILGPRSSILGLQSTGSNSWVVAGKKSTTGKPILADDPHMSLPVPSRWYEMHLVGGGYNLAGVTLPGIPAVVIGRNASITWGLTNGTIDDIDFYIEKINPENPYQYEYEGQWQNMEVLREQIPIRGRHPVELEIRLTQHGPIISEIHEMLDGEKRARKKKPWQQEDKKQEARDTRQEGKKERLVVSMKWTGMTPSDEILAAYQFNHARNWEAFTEALKHFKVPSQNFIYADQEGNIGYQCAGAIPIRQSGSGISPFPGWKSGYEWIGTIPFEELPHFQNPPEGFIATANNQVVQDWYPYYLSAFWETSHRIDRIREILRSKEKFSIEDFQHMHLDTKSLLAKKLIPYILKENVPNPAFLLSDLEGPMNEEERRGREARFVNAWKRWEEVLTALKNWDFDENTDSIGATIFNVLLIKLMENLFKDELGSSLYEAYSSIQIFAIRALEMVLEKGSSSWVDDVSTPEKIEILDDRITLSFNETVEFLTRVLGEDVSKWRWGRLHTLTFTHPLGQMTPLNWIFNLGPYPIGGSRSTLNKTDFYFEDPYDVFRGPSYRQVVDLSDNSQFLTIITPGQSGNRLSPHYRDQMNLWFKGLFHPLKLDRKQIETGRYKRLVLKPSL